jgi:hypothetical protein
VLRTTCEQIEREEIAHVEFQTEQNWRGSAPVVPPRSSALRTGSSFSFYPRYQVKCGFQVRRSDGSFSNPDPID